jgi:cyclophilin family peptidyl-prolyl cis-trans isomerase
LNVTLSSPIARRGLGLAVATALLVAACSAFEPAPTATPATPAPTASPAPTGAPCPPSSPPAAWTNGETATVTLDTTQGRIVIAVDGKLAPHATANFVALAACGFYDGVIFHRVIPGFVVQGGDGMFGRVPLVQWPNIGLGGPGYTIQDDPVTAPYGRGVVAMARGREPNSQGSQFFIVLSDENTDSLDAANTYAILGKVTSGMEAVDAIAALPNTGPPRNAPATDPPPTITKATVTRP